MYSFRKPETDNLELKSASPVLALRDTERARGPFLEAPGNYRAR